MSSSLPSPPEILSAHPLLTYAATSAFFNSAESMGLGYNAIAMNGKSALPFYIHYAVHTGASVATAYVAADIFRLGDYIGLDSLWAGIGASVIYGMLPRGSNPIRTYAAYVASWAYPDMSSDYSSYKYVAPSTAAKV